MKFKVFLVIFIFLSFLGCSGKEIYVHKSSGSKNSVFQRKSIKQSRCVLNKNFYNMWDKPVSDKFNFINSINYKNMCQNEFVYNLNPFIIVVDKSKQKMFLYFYNGKTKLLNTYHIVTGKFSGDKLKQGDRKTPEGIYFFNKFLTRRQLKRKAGKESIRYGDFAATTNYPNTIDKIGFKTGGGIWLHGTDQVGKYDSNGCIVTNNKDIMNVKDFISLKTTPIIITKRLSVAPLKLSFTPSKKVLFFIENWRKNWEDQNIEKYMIAYHKNFKDLKTGRNKKDWKKYKMFLNNKYKKIKVKLYNISVYVHTKYILVQFIQDYRSSGYNGRGIKRLYLKQINNNLKIISEEFVTLK